MNGLIDVYKRQDRPMIAYMEGLREPGRVTASTYYGIDNSGGQHNGFMANTQNTPFGWTLSLIHI